MVTLPGMAEGVRMIVALLFFRVAAGDGGRFLDAEGPTSSYESWPSSTEETVPVAETSTFISELPGPGGGPRWVHGHVTVVRDPLRTLSVLEPGGPGGCRRKRRVRVDETALLGGCVSAHNAGFFNTTSARCLGNVVSDGRLVQLSGGGQNAHFGIRKDGSLVFGYLTQDQVSDRSNPFVQLVTGVVWLLRNGHVYINQSLKMESNRMVDQEDLRDFVDVHSARTVVGHRDNGDLVLVNVDGQTEKRGMNLWEVAAFLKDIGVVNAINLDGGGSSSLVVGGALVSYPADPCPSDRKWRCSRAVSTVLCVHPRHRRVCSARVCVCADGWRGRSCSQACPPGYYGNGCKHTCACFNGALCNHVNGSCVCPLGFRGDQCEQACPPGSCVEGRPCDPQTGSGGVNGSGPSFRWWRRGGEADRRRLLPAEQILLLVAVAMLLLHLVGVVLPGHCPTKRRWRRTTSVTRWRDEAGQRGRETDPGTSESRRHNNKEKNNKDFIVDE